MKKLYILLILFTVLLLASCSQKKSENSESTEDEKTAVTQEQFLANKLKEYLDANPLFLGFYSNGDGDITEYRLEGDKVYRIEYKSIDGEYPEKAKYEVTMYPNHSDPYKWEPVFYNSSDVLYDIYLNINRYDTFEEAVMANYKHDYGPGVKIKSVTATSTLGEKYSAENLIDGSWKSWAEGEEGSGIGTKITFEFERPFRFANATNYACIDIVNGYGDLKHFYQNNRVKEMNLWIDDDSVPVKIKLYDIHNAQTIVLRDYIGDRYVSKLIFEILSVYPGSKYDDTCIAEIHLGSYLEDNYIMPLDPYFAEVIYAYWRDLKNDTEHFRFNNGNLEMFYDNRHDADSDWRTLTLLPQSSLTFCKIDFDGDTPIFIMPGEAQNQKQREENIDIEFGEPCLAFYKDFKLYAYKNGSWKETEKKYIVSEIEKVVSEHEGQYFTFSELTTSSLYADVNDGENINYSIKNPKSSKYIQLMFYSDMPVLFNDSDDADRYIFEYDGTKYVLSK